MITTLHRIWGVMGRHRFLLIRGILATFVEAVFMSLPVGALYLLLIGYEDVSAATVWGITAMLLVGAIGQIACRWYITTRINPLGFVAMADERMRIGARLRRSPMGYFNRTRLGEIASVLTTTMVDAEMWLVWQFLQVVTGVIDVVVISAFLLALDWRIGAVSLLVLVLALAALMIVDRRSDATMGERQRVQAGFVDVVLEFIRGIAVSRAFSMTGVARERMHRAAAEVSRTSLAAEAKIIPFSSLYQFVFKIGTVAMLGLGATLRINGDIDLPRALLFGVAAFVVYQTLEGLNSNVTMLELVAASLDLIEPVRTAPVMEARTSREEPGSRKQPAEAAGRDIVFTDVSFAYEDRRVVDHVDCSIPSGSVCALVGPSGSGKTTLCNLMMRFWDVDSGSISVGGVDVRDQDPEDLLSLFAVVFQDVFLFSDTVANNIRFGRPDASDDEVREAARRARCLDFVEALPDGFDTVLAEGGASLSGGERQRISIARALLKDAPIVILDEATSSVDPENERELQEGLRELCEGKTQVVIAHNLATVTAADQILVLDGGRIVERGRHEDLARAGGTYEHFLQARERAVGWHIAR
ncbi:ABC transporter, ATP-binding protein [Actinobaculum sp. oral taxon 183 str. F0552]|uniref:ABC transporter ATP-binding protein n=1 Tax=Actinobaculum sp. oral taxon 183 TaxID=712888 RepID=UPI000397BC5E|nr:ABC transporter ATP-binding protein [Actinobaculum sp. oral taxon 183]ERH18801.1 ABC transporter, ATP-binding protein [Actinobaculum sp. oral taxon 183 str. F0552]